MGKHWKCVLLAVIALAIGTSTVMAAPMAKKMVLSSEDGTRTAEVADSRLLVNTTGQVSVSNFPEVQQPDPSTIVNLLKRPGSPRSMYSGCWT